MYMCMKICIHIMYVCVYPYIYTHYMGEGQNKLDLLVFIHDDGTLKRDVEICNVLRNPDTVSIKIKGEPKPMVNGVVWYRHLD